MWKNFIGRLKVAYNVLCNEGPVGILWRYNITRTLKGVHPHVRDAARHALMVSQYKWWRFIKSWVAPVATEEYLKFSFLIDARSQDGKSLLRSLSHQLARQKYRNWDCLIAVTSFDQDSDEDFRCWYELDRSKFFFHVLPADVSNGAVLNHLLKLSASDYFHVAQCGSNFYPQTLNWLVWHLVCGMAPAVIYGDEDILDVNSNELQPVFKPEFGEALLWQEYGLGKAVWLHRSQALQVNGFDEAIENATLWDLCWRLLECHGRSAFLHVPRVLLLSTDDQKNISDRYEILSRHVDRSAPELINWRLSSEGGCRVWESAGDQPLVSIIIPTRDRWDLLSKCISSLLEITRYARIEIVVIDNDSMQRETLEYLEALKRDKRIQVINASGDFNFSRLNNMGVAACDGEFVLLLNNDIEITEPDWLLEMVFWAKQREVGCVGAKLWYPDGRLQHGGVVVGVCGVAAHIHRGSDRSDRGYLDRLVKVQNVSAVTGACLLVRRAVYEEVGGLDEVFAVTCNDIDFCLRVVEAGYINMWTPFAELIHHESASRGVDSIGPQRARLNSEVAVFRSRWAPFLRNGDPFYSPNLTRIDENCSLKFWA